MIKVSVIIPVFNVEEYLSKCLSSVIDQTLFEIEIICINDGSTDNSLNILNEFKRKDERILIFSRINHGLGATRNFGVQKAKGEYLLFLDSDDWIEKQSCEILYKDASLNNLDILLGKFRKVYNNGDFNINNHYNNYESETVFSGNEFLIHIKPIYSYNWDKVWKREFFIEKELFNSEDVLYEDLYTTFKGFLYAKRVMYIDYCFYNYYQAEYSITNTSFSSKHLKGREQQFLMVNDLLTKNKLWNSYGFIYSYLNHFYSVFITYSYLKAGATGKIELGKLLSQQKKFLKNQIDKETFAKMDSLFRTILNFPLRITSFGIKFFFALHSITPEWMINMIKKNR